MADIHFHIWLYKRGPDGIIRSMERTGEQFDTRRKANYGPDSTACCTWTQVVLPTIPAAAASRRPYHPVLGGLGFGVFY